MTEEELARYERQIILPEIGPSGQEKLKESKVLIVGMGGLGCPAALYLAAAGIGTVTLADFDSVHPSNLNRQVLYWEEDVGRLKVRSAAEKLRRLNSSIKLSTVTETLDEDNLPGIVSMHDVVLDALDNLETRRQVNRVAVESATPFIYGGVRGMDGMTTWIMPGRTPCLHCLFPTDDRKTIFPVLGTTSGMIAMIQATEVIKYLTGMGELLCGRLLFYDGMRMVFSEVQVTRDPQCAVCRTTENGSIVGNADETEEEGNRPDADL